MDAARTYVAKALDDNLRGSLLFVADDVTSLPQHPKTGEPLLHLRQLWIDRLGEAQLGDTVRLEWRTTRSSGGWYVKEILEHDPSVKGTYERVIDHYPYNEYFCCTKAVKSDQFCVCAIITECPVHGTFHHGTHD
jgi:hypothetical protein